MSKSVTCAYCGGRFETTRRASYCSTACRTAAWKERTGYADPRQRKACRNGKSRASGMQVSYRKAVEAMIELLERTEPIRWKLKPGEARSAAEWAMSRALSDRQRALLEERQTTEGRKAA